MDTVRVDTVRVEKIRLAHIPSSKKRLKCSIGRLKAVSQHTASSTKYNSHHTRENLFLELLFP